MKQETTLEEIKGIQAKIKIPYSTYQTTLNTIYLIHVECLALLEKKDK